jgi:glyoxylase-like metal-dependent hydrolase (beta-lactamase superfamily II)
MNNLMVNVESHCHADHLAASFYLQKKHFPSSKTAIGKGITTVQSAIKSRFQLSDSDLATDGSQFDLLLSENDTLALGSTVGKVLETPGHTPDSVSYVFDKHVFVGDVIFHTDVVNCMIAFSFFMLI